MATRWTDAQSAAIETKNKTLLLSAAAGSGKTSTLTERIIRSITDKSSPADISNMLIVTFTRASALDLKTKIFNAINKALAERPGDAHLTRQLVRLGSANISTIDSFYLNAVRQHFSELSLSSSFRIADSSETDLIAKNVMTDVIAHYYDTEPDFPALCECFEGIRDMEDVMEGVLLSLYDECMHVPQGVYYVRLCSEEMTSEADKDFFDSTYGKVLKNYLIFALGDILSGYEYALAGVYENEKAAKAYGDALESDRAFCLEVLTSLKSGKTTFDSIAETVNGHIFAKLGSLRSEHVTSRTLFCKEIRSTLKDLATQLREEYFCYTSEDLGIFLTKTAKNLALLHKVLSSFEQRFFEEKQRRNILELTDVKRYAYKLFVDENGDPTETAKKYSERFSDIYIDEYQDVDPVQDLIFKSISTPTNRFMVGDIKQSIYSFRGAEPSLFASYRSSFPSHSTKAAENSNCETIFMSENFRCSKPVIDFTNRICSTLFSACKESIGYTSEDDLVFSKGTPAGVCPVPAKVICLAKEPKSEDAPDCELTPAEAEAEYIAQRISELLEHGKKENGEPLSPCDIAVLFRNKRAGSNIADALRRHGIASTLADSSEYFQNPEVLMALSILNAVDNPQRDIHLAAALRSPIFNFSLEDIMLINKHGCDADSLYDKLCIVASTESELGRRCAAFDKELCELRRVSTSLPVDKFLKHLFASDAFAASGLFADKDSAGKGGNLLRLYEYARTFEAGSFKGLYNFIEFINTVIENGAQLENSGSDSSPDHVTLTTIHKSKGLEFPVCFVCNAGANMHLANKASLSFQYGIGIAMDLSDNTGFAKFASPLKKILDLAYKLRSTEEEMRVLYVALTRAREQLYVTGSFSRRTLPSILSASEFLSQFKASFGIMSSPTYMDWVLAALHGGEDEATFEISFLTPAMVSARIGESFEAEQKPNVEENEELTRILKENFSFVYPYTALRSIPAKLSVSRLSPDVLDENDTSLDLEKVASGTRVPDFFLLSSTPSSASRGTATHQFLQFCDFKLGSENGFESELARLLQKGFLPKDIDKLIYKSEIERLFKSEFCREILSSHKVIRERRFNMLFPASLFSEDETLRSFICDERIAVQGVIDLILIDKDGNISLFDYKTDRLTREELMSDDLARKKMNEIHALQLSYYARAVEYLFGKAPVRVAVYSTCAAKLFDIDIKI